MIIFFNRLSFLAAMLIVLGVLGCKEKPEYEPGVIVDLSSQSGDRWVQEHYIIVEGSVHDIWEMYSTTEAMKQHVAPVMEVDFRIGGKWEASYDLTAQIGDSANFVNEIVNIIPYRSFTTKGVKAPFDMEALKSLRTTMDFEQVDDNLVKVSAITTGWEGVKDEEYRKKVYQASQRTNPEILRCLQEVLVNGPLNWEEVLAQN